MQMFKSCFSAFLYECYSKTNVLPSSFGMFIGSTVIEKDLTFGWTS
jgi:hypothetical protein